MKTFFYTLFFCFNLIGLSFSRYVLPDVHIQALSPRGLSVSMPETSGANIQLFGFHANINKPIRGKEQGIINRSSTHAVKGNWVIVDDSVSLKIGDKVHYWIFVQSNRLGYDKEDQVFEITELFDKAAVFCDKSETLSTTTAGDSPCSNAVIFEDDFNNYNLDESLWEVLKFSPTFSSSLLGQEFVSYENNRENLFISNGVLNIKPTLTAIKEEELYSKLPLDLRNGCSIDNDDRACYVGLSSYEILPPIRSARIRSKHAFKYARVEVEAKLPIGDWIVPHILLEPRDYKYGPNYQSGELYVAYARGNKELMKGGENIGQKSYYCGPWISDDRTKNMFRMEFTSDLGEEFRTFALEFRSDGLTCWAGARKVWDYKYQSSGFKSKLENADYTKRWTSNSAPFDQYFHLTIGLSVGGITDFGGITDELKDKPWDNSDPRKTTNFFNDMDNWHKSWSEDSTLKIKHVRIYAI